MYVIYFLGNVRFEQALSTSDTVITTLSEVKLATKYSDKAPEAQNRDFKTDFIGTIKFSVKHSGDLRPQKERTVVT